MCMGQRKVLFSRGLQEAGASRGETLWHHPSSFSRNASILSPLLQVPDVDSDGIPDLLVLTQEQEEVSGHLYSGRNGDQIGLRGSLGVDGESGFLLHVTRTGAHYILFPCASSLCSWSVKDLYEKVTGRDGLFRKDPLWESMFNATTHRMLSHSSGAVRYLMHVPGSTGTDVFLVGSEACVLLDGQKLTQRWPPRAARVLRYGVSPGVRRMLLCSTLGVSRWLMWPWESRADLITGASFISLLAESPCAHFLAVPENPSSATTNQTPWLSSLKTELVPTDRFAALPLEAALKADGAVAQEAAAPSAAKKVLPPSEHRPAGWRGCRHILFLDLSTGDVLRSLALPSLPGGPLSTSLPTADHRSAFFFWGLHELGSTSETVWEPPSEQPCGSQGQTPRLGLHLGVPRS
ncbi:hypothetical protein P7K49_022605 [Saguinus oedipus]|uniref:FAM234A/B beta-propeller domain-containing protein n=1 Tax=Saguinus oedipus TaxID=9490 RepID=A0ABQ9UK66_SAGOE|nr:hypothetical protein P7K49_022605 [Saguinus oedipus]